MASPLLSFAAGMGSGYLSAQRQQELDAERQADRAMRKENHDAQMEEIAQQRTMRRGLADAVKPIGVTEGATMGGMTYDDAGVANSDFRQNRTMGMDAQAPQQAFTAGGKAYGNRAVADAAAVAHNSSDATMGRVGSALMASDPAKAMSLKNASLQNKVTEANFTEAQRATARKIQEEGYSDAARFARMGDEQGVFDAFNKNGTEKLAAVPTKTMVERDINGQKIQTFDYQGQIIGADGVPKPFKINSLDLSMKLMPYDKMIEEERKGADSKSKIGLQNAQAEFYGSRKTNEDIRDPNLRGGPPKTDTHDRKSWSEAFLKADKSVISLPTGEDGKEVVSSDLSVARRMLMDEYRQNGYQGEAVDPSTATVIADERITQMKNKAQAMVEADRAANKNSTLTVQKVIADMIKKAGVKPPETQKPSTKPDAAVAPVKSPGLADAAKSTPAAPTGYVPPANSPAARMLQERNAAQGAARAAQEAQMMQDAQKRIDEEARVKKQAEEFRKANNIR